MTEPLLTYPDAYGFLILFADHMGHGKTGALASLSDGSQRVKHSYDFDRNKTTALWTRDGKTYPARMAFTAFELLQKLDFSNPRLAIDEVEFFDRAIIDLIFGLMKKGWEVLASFLPGEAQGSWFPFADFDNGIDLNFIRSYGGPMSLFDFTAEGHFKGISINPHYTCTHEDEVGKCQRLATSPVRIIEGVHTSYGDNTVVVGDKIYFNMCPFHTQVPGRDKHFAVRDLARLLAWNAIPNGKKKTSISDLQNADEHTLDNLASEYAEVEQRLTKKDILTPNEISTLRWARIGRSQVEMYRHPEYGRFHLLQYEGIEKKLEVLESKNILKTNDGIILP
jgi:thymidine kinase